MTFTRKDFIMRSAALILLLALGLTACKTAALGGNASTNDPLAPLAQFTATDLRAALLDATAHSDQAGINCWGGLLEILGQLQAQGANRSAAVGIASAIQHKRDLLGQSGGGGVSSLNKAVNVACAALVNDEAITLLKFGGMLGISGFSGIPMLP